MEYYENLKIIFKYHSPKKLTKANMFSLKIK